MMQVYLNLEKAMLALDARDSDLADQVRDIMDAVWARLTNEDHMFLNTRKIEDK